MLENDLDPADSTAQTDHFTVTVPSLPKCGAELKAFLAGNQTSYGTRRTAARKAIFLEAYANSWGKKYYAIKESGMSPSGFYRWVDKETGDPKFIEAIDMIDGLIADRLEEIIDEKISKDRSDKWLERKISIMRPEKWYTQTPSLRLSGDLNTNVTGGAFHIILDKNADVIHDSTSNTI